MRPWLLPRFGYAPTRTKSCGTWPRKHGESLPDTLDRIIEEKRRAQIFAEANAAYAAIADDPVEAELWRAEIAAWDGTLLDGLPKEPESSDEEYG